MSTEDERMELRKDPLPVEQFGLRPMQDYVTGCPAEVVLDRIVEIDESLDWIHAHLTPYIEALMAQKNQLLKRAVQEGIKKGQIAVLIETESKKLRNKITDNEAFILSFPEGYRMIRERQKRDLDDKHELAVKRIEDGEIPLGVADDVIGKKAVTEFVGYQPVKITYEVRRRS